MAWFLNFYRCERCRPHAAPSPPTAIFSFSF
jgi:hypothetical protein